MKMCLIIVAAALAIMAAIGQARAQAGTPSYVYSVKYVCGLQIIASTQFRPPAEPPVKPGNYATAINIHNYHTKETSIATKAVVAGGQIGKLAGRGMLPNQALNLSCAQIVAMIPPTTAPLPMFIEGFVEIVSPVQLSVAAVYTSQTCINPGAKCSMLGELSIDVVTQSAFRDQ
jgi:hypothetical protein